jgi:hypothetical protein
MVFNHGFSFTALRRTGEQGFYKEQTETMEKQPLTFGLSDFTEERQGDEGQWA